MTRAFVTGATGFVGSAILRALVEDGSETRCLVRPGTDRANIRDIETSVFEGDLVTSTEDDLARALDGCDELHHCAALYAFWARDPADFTRVNVEGTRKLVRAATRAGVARIVYTSSVATVQPVAGASADEASWARVEDAPGPYKRSKILAEQEALRLVREEGAPLIIVNPSAPVGPRDIKPTPTGKLIVDFLGGRMPAYVDTGLNVVDVDDVGAGHVLAARRGVVGERYILGGENLSLHEILLLLADVSGRTAPRWQIPHAVAIGAAAVSELVGRVRGRAPAIPLEATLLARKAMYFDATRAARELGFTSRPAREALEKAVEWFARQRGLSRGFGRPRPS